MNKNASTTKNYFRQSHGVSMNSTNNQIMKLFSPISVGQEKEVGTSPTKCSGEGTKSLNSNNMGKTDLELFSKYKDETYDQQYPLNVYGNIDNPFSPI